MAEGRSQGPPPDRAGELLERGAALLRRLGSAVRTVAVRAHALVRERWPAARTRAGQAWRRIDGVTRKAARQLGPAVAEESRILASAATDGWAWLRPRIVRGIDDFRGAWRAARPRLRRAALAMVRPGPTRRRAAIIGLVAVGFGWILWQRCGLAGCPDVARLATYQPDGASVLLDHRGQRFADLAPIEHEVVSLESLPPYIADAFVAVEDRRFFEHRGVDWVRVLGAAWADLRAGALVQGSSTIPMQLARTLFDDRIRLEDKTFRRKLLEVRMAGELEDRFSKEEVLELYLNHVYLGAGTYGVQAASRYWFGKEARELSLEEAAMLAALPKAPSHYDPRRHPQRARERRDLVLALMVEQERITLDAADSARERPLVTPREPDRDFDGDRLAPYFIEHVRRFLEDELGEALYTQRLRIVTTLDVEAQRAAEEALEAQLLSVEGGAYGRARAPTYDGSSQTDARTEYLQGAVVVLDAHTGAVRVWVGGRDYDASRYDRARLARRQAGSAFKPFVYAAAIEAGFVASQPILDAPYRLARSGSRAWEPENYSGDFEGIMSMREALVRSQNVPAVRLAATLGNERIADFARRAGITGDVPASPVAALGVTTATPLEMAVAYAAFAAGGTRPAPRFILRVEDEDGDVLFETEPARERVTDRATAFLITDILRDVVDRGTGTGVRSVGFDGPAAGKTGTTSDATDVWFVGYTPELVGAVWIGFDEIRPLPSRATGGGIAAPVWGRVMNAAHAGTPTRAWQRPPDVVVRTVDAYTGLVLRDDCHAYRGDVRQELFVAGREPISTCAQPRRRSSWLDRFFGYRAAPVPPRIPGPTDPNLGVPRLPTVDGAYEPEPRKEPRRRGRPLGREIVI